MTRARRTLVVVGSVVLVLIAVWIGPALIVVTAYDTPRIFADVRALVGAQRTVALERHGDIPLNVRQTAWWKPHWPNPVGYRQTLAIAWSPDGTKLAVAYNWGTKIKIIDPAGNALATAEVPNGPNITTSLAFLNGSSQVLFVGQDTKQIKFAAFTLFDAQSGKLLRTIPGPNPGRTDLPNHAYEFAVSPDQRLAAMTILRDRSLFVYRTDTWELVRRIENVGSAITAPTFLSDNRHVFVSIVPSQFVQIDLVDGRILNTFKVPGTDDTEPAAVPRTDPASSIAISPDLQFLFAGTQGKFVINERESTDRRAAAQVFDLTDGVRKAAFDLAVPEISKAAWDPKNRFVAFVDDASHLFLWQPLARHLSYLKIDLPSRAWSLALSPDGSQIAVSTGAGLIIYAIQ